MKQNVIEKNGSILLHIDRVCLVVLDYVFPYFRFYLSNFDAEIILIRQEVIKFDSGIIY